MKVLISIALLIMFSCSNQFDQTENVTKLKPVLHEFIDNWHKAAAETNDSIFFGSMAENSIYIGTDASELWTKNEFYNFAKKYFDNGEAWEFKPIERNVYFNNDYSFAWFDEKLDTWMGVCRASGVLQCKNEEWKIVHYHLSMTVPNEKVQEVIEIIEKDSIKN